MSGQPMRPAATGVGALLAALLLGAAPHASAALGTIEQAYELTRSQVQLPGRPDGTLTLRPCPDCRFVALRTTAATAWFTEPGARQPAGHAAVLAAFRAAATNPATLVYVYYEPQTLRVRRVVLDVPNPVTSP